MPQPLPVENSPPRRRPLPGGRAAWQYAVGIFYLSRGGNLLLLGSMLVMASLFLVKNGVPIEDKLSSPLLWLAVVSTCCVTAAGYILNDYFDLRIDRINKPDRVMIERRIPRRQALFWHGYLSMVGLGCAFMVGQKLFILTIGVVVLLTLYSAYLKRTPLYGNLLVALLSATAVIVAGLWQNAITPAMWVFFTFSFLGSLMREIIKDIEDLPGDAALGCRTLPVTMGIQGAKNIVAAIGYVFIILLPVLSYPLSASLFLFNLAVAGLGVYLVYQLPGTHTVYGFRQLSRVCKAILGLGVVGILLV